VKKEETKKEETGTEKPKETATVKSPDSAPPSYAEPSFSPAELDVLQSLVKRREEIDKREQQITQREALLKAAESEIDRKLGELNKVKGELNDLLNKQQTAQNDRINSLVKIYEGMKPKEAARIFDTLEMDVLLSVIGKMSERKSSPILASMNPDKARIVTIRLSEQSKLPGMPVDAPKPATPPPAPKPPPLPADE